MQDRDKFELLLLNYITENSSYELLPEKEYDRVLKSVINKFENTPDNDNKVMRFIEDNLPTDTQILYEHYYDYDLVEILETVAYEVCWNKKYLIDYIKEIELHNVNTYKEFILLKQKESNFLGEVSTLALDFLDYEKIYVEFFENLYHETRYGFLKKLSKELEYEQNITILNSK